MTDARRGRPGKSPTRAAKPLDVGNGLLSASFGSGGRWLWLGGVERRHGYAELSALPEFRAEWRRDPAAVRRYRRWMADDSRWFLRLDVPGERGAASGIAEAGSARWRLAGGALHREVTAWACAGRGRIVQLHRLRAADAPPERLELRFRGALRAHPLAEITEVDPPAPARFETELSAGGTVLAIEAPGLDLRVGIGVAANGAATGAWELDEVGARLGIEPDGGRRAEIVVRVERGLGAGQAHALAARAAGRRPPPPRPRPCPSAPVVLRPRIAPAVPVSLRRAGRRLARQNWSYISGCTALAVAPDEVCIVTDHRVLPLSWTRDAYYQALLLLTLDTPDGRGRRLVASHLRWLWGRCERPRGLWMRSHRPDGSPKDLRYQADQQLYPLLELADYRRATGELPLPPRAAGAGVSTAWWRARVSELWSSLPVVAGGLLPTDETPADDVAGLPFALSSQILYRHAAIRIAELLPELELAPAPAEVAGAIDDATRASFRTVGPFGPQWAYETDARGETRLYHDANDLPTALAPALGFCSVGDPLWTATMRFAFSEHNPGYSPGEWGGLGSRHTPGTWTLGDVQDLIVAWQLADGHRSRRALERLLGVAGADGLLPEAYDSATGADPVRLWFAWPGAILGTLLAGAETADGAADDASRPRRGEGR